MNSEDTAKGTVRAARAEATAVVTDVHHGMNVVLFISLDMLENRKMNLDKVGMLGVVIVLVFVVNLTVEWRQAIEGPLTPELFEILT